VLAGPDDRDPTSLPAQDLDFIAAARTAGDLSGKRIAYAGDLAGLVPQDPEVQKLGRRAAQRLQDLGAEVADDCFDTSSVIEIMAGTRGFGMIGRYADRYDRHKVLMTPPLVNQIEAALKLDLRAVTRAERLRGAYWHQIRKFLQDYDFIVTPTIGVPPFRLDQPLPEKIGERAVARYYDAFLSTYAFSITGLPVIAVPAGLTAGGLPVGIQIVGPRQREDLVIAVAAAYERAHPELFVTPEIDLSQAKELGQAFSSPGLVLKRPL